MSGGLDSPRRHVARNPRRPAATGAGAANSRTSQKEATRKRVLEAARDLFETEGYQGATIRAIAKHAGVSVGSVFTTFASKGEILSEVMEARLDALYAELDRVVPHLRGSTEDRLKSIFAIFIDVESARSKLFLSHIAAAFDWTLPPSARPFGSNVRLRGIVRDCLAMGVEGGDVATDADLNNFTDLLVAAYGWVYRRVVTEAADAKALTAAMDAQIALIARGFTPR